MRSGVFPVLCIIGALAASGAAQDITGTITIKKRLTKPSVTAPVSVYQRGTTIKLGKDAVEDPITVELAHVAIYLEGPEPAGPAPDAHGPLEVQQADRRFGPDFVVIPAGSAVAFANMDPIFHNVYSLSKAKSFDLGNYDRGKSRSVTFQKPGIVEVYCHLHPNMAATVVVTPNRWYAQPGKDGQYRIPDVPPGKYTLVAWHRTAGFFRKQVKVTSEHKSTADFFIPVDVDSVPGGKTKAEGAQ
jgi:plastocyanin